MSDEHIYKSHNKSVLLYHLVFAAKYKRKVFTEEVGERLKEICIEIEECCEIRCVEIGMEEERMHFLVQSVPKKGAIFELPEDKEGNPLGRGIVDERILCEYSWAVCKQRNDNKIHTKSRTVKERIQTDIRKSAGTRLWLITGS